MQTTVKHSYSGSMKINNKKISCIIIWLFTLILVITGQPGWAQTNPEVTTYYYQVDFLMIPSVKMSMKITDPVQFKNKTAAEIAFKTHTFGVFNRIYPVNNHYRSIYDPENYQIYYRAKQIAQPHLKQELSAVYDSASVVYSNGKTLSIPPQTHGLFSLLMHLRSIATDSLPYRSLPLEIEGLLYEASFKPLSQEILLLGNQGVVTQKIQIKFFALNPGRPAVVPRSDLFYGNIATDKGEKLVWIEKKAPHRIIKAKFSVAPLWLVAKLLADES